jgi:endoglucanase
VGRKLVVWHGAHGATLLPGVMGFSAEDRADGPVVNLSYWVFPAFARLPIVAPEFDWVGLGRNGLALVEQARFGSARLPTDWVSLHGAQPRPADGFPQRFSYNAIRIPLYVAWAGLGRQEVYTPFAAAWHGQGAGPLPIIDTATGMPAEWLGEKGYAAIASLTACAADGTRFAPEQRRVLLDESYYAVTLHLLARVAAQMRYPSCLTG